MNENPHDHDEETAPTEPVGSGGPPKDEGGVRKLTRSSSDKLGKRPLLSLLPLWLARKAGDRASRRR